jgi:hypothetical protein
MDDKFFQGEHEGIHLTGGSRKVAIVVDPRKPRDKAICRAAVVASAVGAKQRRHTLEKGFFT